MEVREESRQGVGEPGEAKCLRLRREEVREERWQRDGELAEGERRQG